MVVDLARPANLLDPALVHDGDPIGDLHRLLLVVGDQHGRHALFVVQPAQPSAQLRADVGVQRAERLVEQQHARLDGERAGKRHPLALAARELGGTLARPGGQAHQLQQLIHPRLDDVLGSLADPQTEGDVVADRHVRKRRVVLEDKADAALLRARRR